MTSVDERKEQIWISLEDKEYRDAYVSDHIDTGIAFQIRATREARGWSQEQLGERVGMKQEQISLFENPDYGKYTLTTLKRLASALDVALLVRFVPFSALVMMTANMSLRDLALPTFDEDSLEPISEAGGSTHADTWSYHVSAEVEAVTETTAPEPEMVYVRKGGWLR